MPMSAKLNQKNNQNHVFTSLDHSEAYFQTMFDTAVVGIGIMSLDRKLIDGNPAFFRMFGYLPAELIGKEPLIVTYPEDYPGSTRQFTELVSGKLDSFCGERRYRRKNGEIFWASVTMSMVRDESANPLYLVGMLIDIDEQKKILEKLEQSEERFRTIFENTPTGIALLGLDGRILTVNPAILKMTGFTEQELHSMSGLDFTHPDDHTAAGELMAGLISGKGKNFEVESRFIRKNGDIYWVRQRVSSINGPDGKPTYMVVMVEDIDNQKRVLAELRDSEQHFRAVFENSAIGISLVDLDRHPIAINKALLDMTGYSSEELQLLTGPELSYSEDREIGNVEFWDVVNGKRDSYQVEKRYVRKNGSIYWVRLTVSGVHGDDGQLLYLISMTEDITSMKIAEESFRASETRLRAIFENTSVGIALTDLDRKIIQVNEAAARITGYSLEELLQINPINLSLPEDRLIGQAELLEMIAGKREGMIAERRFVRKDGRVFWGRVTYSLIRDILGNPQYLIGLIEDISEEKQAAEKLARQEMEYLHTLEQRVEERTHELSETNLRLVHEIEQRQVAEEALAAKAVEEAVRAERTRLAHDLHDAVTQTLFSASLIAEVLPELWVIDPDEARKSNEELRQLTRGALAEMRTLLFELRPAALTQARFSDLIKQLSDAVIGRARIPVNLVVEGDNVLPPEIKVAFYRIAQECLNNIVKYARASRINIAIQLDLSEAHMEIIDNGIGFDQSSIKPTSLGMHIMHDRAQAIHASLEITSTPGNGTQVRLNWKDNGQVEASKISE
jgi:PAS domain S-box-containing protein